MKVITLCQGVESLVQVREVEGELYKKGKPLQRTLSLSLSFTLLVLVTC